MHTRLLPTLMVDALGLMLATINRIAPWAPLPSELAGLTAVIDLHPRLRELAAGRMHSRERADSTTSMAAAVLHGLAARGEGTAAAEPVVVARPRPLPENPADRYARRAITLGAAATAAAMPFTGPRRAIGFGLAALPKAPGVAQAAFAARLGRLLARRGTLVMDRAALRGLELVDTLMLDAGRPGHGPVAAERPGPVPGQRSQRVSGTSFSVVQ